MSTYHAQDSVMQDYKTSGVFRNEDDEGALHMFFSPYRIPDGLTDEEVRVCIDLHPRRKELADKMTIKRERTLRDAWKKRLSEDYLFLEKIKDELNQAFGPIEWTMDKILTVVTITILCYEPIPLPRDLINGPMTRERFANGIAALIARLDELEKTV